MKNSLEHAYDPENFRAEGHKLVDFLADKLKQAMSGEHDFVLEWTEPDEAYAQLDTFLDNPNELFERTWQQCIRLHDPRFMGHQISPPLPIAALAGLFSDFVNNGMGIYEMGVAGTAMERFVVKTVARQIGFDEHADGVMTSGGSLGNLTALLAARSRKAKTDVWNVGTQEPLSVMVSDQAHYCIDRAVRMMGWGSEGVIMVPTEDFRMRTDLLEAKLKTARANGRDVIAVIGSACCTSTGTFDDLVEIGKFCERHDLWFHVDGAHGGASMFSKKYRHLVDGIETADSVVMDFHKLLMTPAVTTALLFRDGNAAYQSFSQQAHYLWNEAETPEWFNLAKRTFECTKTMMSLKVFSIIAKHGLDIFDENVTRLHDLAAEFAELIQTQPDLELATEPQTNIVCFRYVGDESNRIPLANLSEVNRRIRYVMMTAGRNYLVQTTLGDELWLRTTIANPFTSRKHFDDLFKELRSVATTILADVS